MTKITYKDFQGKTTIKTVNLTKEKEETKDKKVRSLYLHKTKDENYFQTT